MTGPISQMGKLRLRKAKWPIQCHRARVWLAFKPTFGQSLVSSLYILAYPLSVGGSLLAHVNVAFFTVMLFAPPPEKHQHQYVRQRQRWKSQD